MANKDGIVSIGFDYKKELEEVCATIERELNNLGGDINLSDSMKKQMTEMKKMIAEMKQDIGSSFDKLSTTKLDTKAFESFKKDVNKKIKEVGKEVNTLKEQFSVLDSSSAVNGVVEQFANLKKYVEESNRSISEFIGNTERIGKTATITPAINTGVLKSEIEEIKDLLSRLGKEDFDFGYSTKSAKELGVAARDLVFDYRDISEEIDDVRDKLKSMNSSDVGFKEQQAHLSKLSLELVECGRKIDDIFGATNSPSVDWEKYLDIDEVEEISKYIAKKTEEIRANAQKIVNSVSLSGKDSNVKSDNGNYVSRNNNVELHISTKQSTINKQLDEMIDNLQQRAASKPIIAPVKLRVDSEYEKTTKDASASALTENQINEARKDVESVVPGLEKAFNNSMRIATNKAVENAKESIKAVREFFESNPITVHLTVPEDERLKIGKAILSEDGKTTVDISGQVDRARKSVKGLSEDLEKSQLLIKENAQNAKNLSLDKLVDSLSETVSQFSEIKTVISSIQNIDDGSIQKLSVDLDGVISKFDELISTVKTATNALYSIIKQSNVSELDKQWSSISNKFKSIADESGKINLSKQKTDIKELMDMYQKYESVGGTNSLMSLTDNVETIRKLDKEYQKLNQTQTVDNSSTIEKESEAFTKVEKSVDSLTTAIGDTKVQAINIEATAMEDAAEREIVAIKAILDNLDLVINRLNDIKGIKLPKIEVDNIDVVENVVKSLDSVGNKSNISSDSTSQIGNEAKTASDYVEEISVEIKNNTEEWNKAAKAVRDYRDILGDTYNVVQKIRTDKDGERFISYQYKGENGNSITLGENGDLVSSTRQVSDALDQKKLANQREVLNLLDEEARKDEIINELKKQGTQQEEELVNKNREYIRYWEERLDLEDQEKLAQKQISKEIEQQTSTQQKKWQAFQKEQADYEESVNKVNNAISKTDEIISNLSLHDKLDAQFMDLLDSVEKLNSKLKTGEISISEYNKSVKSLTSEYSKLVTIQQDRDVETYKQNAKAAEQEAKQIKDLSESLKEYQDKLSAMSYKPDADHRFPEYQAQLNKINAAIAEYEAHIKSLSGKDVIDKSDITKAEELEDKIKSLLNETKKFSPGDKGFTSLGADKALEKINSILQQNSAFSRQAKQQIQAYYNEILNGNPTRPLNEILDSVYKIVQAERLAGREGKSFLDTIKDKAWYGWAAQLAGTFGIYDVVNVGREIVSNVKDIDTALTELRKVSDATEQRLTANFKNSAETAKELGSSVSDVISATADWSRMGYNIDQSEELARISTLYKNVGDGIDIEDANNSLISTLQGFQLDASQAESIIDRFNEVANNYAIDSAGIGEALQRSAASFNAANTDLSKSIALITATNEVVQDPDSVGKMMPTYTVMYIK